MLEVEVREKKVRDGLITLTSLPEWDYFIAYLSQIRESERDKIEKVGMSHDETMLTRGQLKRLKRLLELREDVRSDTASTADEVED
jgi:hypothetical protein|tara:strand:+ start:2257 stop:2514 length:258 start_codon:yes stop_codon:yes gene_type:complete